MKKINLLLILTISLLGFLGCEENEDVIAVSQIDYVAFQSGFTLNVDPAGSASQDIKIYASTIESSDRSYSINVVAAGTSATAAAYTIPASVTIPANTNIGVFTLTGNGPSIDADGDTLELEFVSSNELFVGENIVINLKAFCPFTLDDIVGTWEGTTSYGYPTQMVTSLNNSGQLEITGIAVGFMTVAWGEVITNMASVVVDVDLNTGNFTIANTPYMNTTYNGAPQATYNIEGAGSFTVCATVKIDLDYDLVQAGTSYTAWLTEGNGWPAFEEHNVLSN